MNLFDTHKERLKLKQPVRLFEAFSGIGTQAMALKRLGVEIEHIGISEIDKYVLASYKAIHGDVKNYGDIMKIDGNTLPEIDIFTWSFPCTDLSKAGKQKGLNGTRSGLGYQVVRIIGEMKIKPQVLLMENVPDLLSPKFREGWQEIYHDIEKLGYSNYVEVLNAKNYGVAQNRDRVFMVSILRDYSYTFPIWVKLEKRLKDYLEDEVDEKYYLSEKQLKAITNPKYESMGIDRIPSVDDDTANAITTSQGDNREPKIIEPICINSQVNGKQPSLQDRIYDTEAISTAITTSYMPSIAIPEATKQGYAMEEDGDGVYINRPHQKRGVVQKGMIQTLKTSGDDIGVVVNGENNIITLEYIYGLCGIIDMKESVKYERSKPLLRVLWEEIGKKEIQQEIRRLYGFQEKEILRQDVHEKRVFEDWKQSQSNLHKRTYDSKNDQQLDIKENNLRDMWERFKRGYTPQRWELEEQQFRQLNEFMSQLPQQTTQGKTKVRNMRGNNERFRVLQQTLYSLQEIWRPTLSQEQSKMRIRKLCPIEVWRLMGISDEDFYKAQAVVSNSQLYKQAGNAIVVDVLMAIFGKML